MGAMQMQLLSRGYLAYDLTGLASRVGYVAASGAITAVLINTPGTPAAAATCLDGYPLAQKGEAGRALGMATVSSVIGGIFSVFVLVFFAPLLAQLAYEFGQPEYFALAIFMAVRWERGCL